MSREGLEYISEEGRDVITDSDEGDIHFKEFKQIINRYDENVVNTLMPFMVNILDCMNVGYQQKLEYEAKLQKIMKDNIKFQSKEHHLKTVLEQQLEEFIAKYEAERDAKEFLENRIAEYEKEKEMERQAMETRVEALEIQVQDLEQKFKISTECIEKLEDRESYLKKEYSGLLERYTRLFKEHIDFIERSNIPRLHRSIVSDDSLNITLINDVKKLDVNKDAENVNDDEEDDDFEEEHVIIDVDTDVEANDGFSSDEQYEEQPFPNETQYEECSTEKETDVGIDGPNLYDGLSLTESIKGISRIPVRRY